MATEGGVNLPKPTFLGLLKMAALVATVIIAIILAAKLGVIWAS